MKNFLLSGLLVFVAFGAIIATATAQVQLKEPDTAQLSCGQKVLVDNRTCPAGQILEIVGSCREVAPAPAMPRGVQYNCIKRK